ncbi:MAG: hypothetical protein V3U87_15715 [Methylococcaceae bacterium]
MTNKITPLTMFALAAFALGGMLVSPAYASTFTQTPTVNSADGSVTITDANGCGSGHELRTSLTTYHNQDEVTVWVNATDCSSFSKAVVTIEVNGNWEGYATTYNDNVNLNFSGIPISSGDKVEAISVYYY